MIVQQDAVVDLQSSLGFKGKARVIFEFHSTDPFAVQMIFDTACDCEDYDCSGHGDKPLGPVWYLARSILADALVNEGLQGTADVQASRDGDKIRIFLDSSEGTAAIKVDALLVSGFIRKVYEATPEGDASKIFQDQVDSWLSEVLLEG